MSGSESPAVVILVVCLAAAAYTYAVYPGFIWVLSRLFGRRPVRPAATDDDLPHVSLVIAAHNEEAEIEARVANALASDYPPDKFEVVVASDGSTDRTNAIVRGIDDPRVRLLAFSRRQGKAGVLNEAIPRAAGDVVMLSDANTHTAPDAARKLAAWFLDPSVCAVCGKLVLTDRDGAQNADGLYWKYETFLKLCESRLGALLGSNGAIYAVRKPAFVPLPPGTLVDDFVLPLLAKVRTGGRIVYDPEAVADEETAPDLAAEFRRRVRIGAGGFQSIKLLRGLLHPSHGWVALTFASHKVLRWLCPFFLIAALLANLALAHLPGFTELLVAQVGFYLAAVVGHRLPLPARPRAVRALRLPSMFVLLNAALVVGFLRWARGPQSGPWQRTARAAPEPVLAPEPVPALVTQ
jgi:cellulose synthase/poly-beta-1,6-N-acetylglucosamine synthase-like glycosyltransferase